MDGAEKLSGNVDVSTLTVFGFAAGSGMLERSVCVACETIGVRAQPVGYCEREAFAASVIVEGMADPGMGEAAIWDDAQTFDGRRWRGCVDIFTAGYPCQPFSLAGKRLGESDPRHLWPEVRRVIEEMQPELLFLENVSAHLTLGFDTVASELAGLGYSVTPGLFTASETGASHRRERLFVLGLADCDSSRRQRRQGIEGGQEQPTGGWRNRLVDGGPGIQLRAPRQNDWPAWEAAAGLEPSVMPCIERPVRGVADGLASRADRLRCVGNGVDALAAAYAFLTLLACATGGGTED